MNSMKKLLMIILPFSPVLLVLQFVFGIRLAADKGTLLFKVLVSLLISLALYISHTIKNNALKSAERVIWIALVFIAGSIGQIFYWFRYVR